MKRGKRGARGGKGGKKEGTKNASHKKRAGGKKVGDERTNAHIEKASLR